jgi:hypothetical protein
VLLVAAALVAALLASTFSVNLGPVLRRRAEQAATSYMKRPMHIGRLSVRLFTGRFELDNVVIEGLAPTDRPFLQARRITVSLPWWTILTGELIVQSVHMTDWDMVIETFPDGRHSMPKLTPEHRSTGPRRFVTTVKMVRTDHGRFTFIDHGAPWSVVCPNLSVLVTRARGAYIGRASFSGGIVQIQSFLPMAASMETGFVINGPQIHLNRIDLTTDGARSVLTGDVDVAHWPEQLYHVHSRVDFPRMRQIFFAGETWRVTGVGDFDGTFHLYKGGRELKGRFASAAASVDDYAFTSLTGALLWLPDRFEVTDAAARFYGGRAAFDYVLSPLGAPGGAPARFDASYQDVDLAEFSDFLGGDVRLAGRATGRNRLEWRLGRFSEHHGDGTITAVAPDGVAVLPRVLPPAVVAAAEARPPEMGPFNPRRPFGHEPVGGTVTYAFGPDTLTLAPSHVATPTTFISFQGETAYGERSRIPFHLTSADWQESDRLLTAIMTTFGSPTNAVPIGGYGGFDGVMLNAFRHPRVEGAFTGHRMRAWDVQWGEATGRVVVENGYADISDAVVSERGSTIRIDGKFSLGFPREDHGEEMNATILVDRRPLVDPRHAFQLDDYDFTGTLSGEFHLYGSYTEPYGFGKMTVEDGTFYGERFQRSTASLRFEGPGVRLDAIEMHKDAGVVTGAAYVAWVGTYSFNADGERIPVERVQALTYPRAPLSGVLQFTASGSGAFEAPRYDVKGRIADLFAGDEGIGQVTGRLSVRGELLTLEVEAASPRLSVTGSGRIALTPQADAELTFRFSDTSFDPYLRFFEPRLSPFTTAVASGTVRVVGELFDVRHLMVDTRVESLNLKLFDYQVHNEGPVELALDQNTVTIGRPQADPAQDRRVKLVGQGTELELSGTVDLGTEQVNVRATGDANLGILQGFFRDLRSSGGARLVAEVHGPVTEPVISGSATITDGRIRHFALPHGLSNINGRIAFDAGGIRVDGVTATLGGGAVRFGGRIGLKGYAPGELALTATGQRMELRYPEGFRSEVDAELALRGDVASPVLSGTVRVLRSVFTRRFEGDAELFNLTGGSSNAAPAPVTPTFPLRYDIHIVAPSSLRIDNNVATIVASADLTLRGDYDRPLLFGRAEIDHGEVTFEGNRYQITHGTIDFTNPTRIEPFFDVEAETRVRVPSQTYRVTFRATGTLDRFVPEFSSDPPLPALDVVSLVLGQIGNPQDAEIQALRAGERSQQAQQALLAGAARLLTSPISSGVGRAVEQTFGVDTVQITPLVGDLNAQSLNPAARVTIGKRISGRVFLTFSRAVNTPSHDQIILLEYDQSDRVSWIVSQNEDKTYALDFRVRHVF